VKNASEDASGDLGGMQVVPLEFHQALAEADNNAFSALHQQPRHPLADQPYFIEEAQRPGQLMPILEDEHGTYIMNSKDLRAVEHIERLVKIGVNSLKVEGRTKSLYYAARTAQVYRQAIDDAVAGRPFDISLLGQLQGLANRGYTDGFTSAITRKRTRTTCAARPRRTAASMWATCWTLRTAGPGWK